MRKAYPNDITREQFEIIRKDLEGARKATHPRKYDSRVDVGFTPHTPHGTVHALLTHTALHFIFVPVCKTN